MQPDRNRPCRIGISGAGFIGRAVHSVLRRRPGFEVSGVLTRRPVAQSAGAFPEGILTNSVDALIEGADIVLECSGDALHAAEVLLRAGEAGRRLVTMNSEAQVTVGSALLRRGFSITEAHGDQPGAQAQLLREIGEFGFRPLVFVNFKGFQDPNPTPENMAYWSRRLGSTVRSVTSFTDGTKLQIEQILVANGLGAGIARQGMLGGETEDLLDLDYLAEAALEKGMPIADYVGYNTGPKGVLILATSEDADRMPDYSVFAKIRTRKGRAYMLLKPHYFVHLEVPKTLREVVAGRAPLLTNGLAPRVTVAAVAKRPIAAGSLIGTGLGGFDLRGEALEIAEAPDAVPVTLTDGARTRRAIEPGEILREGDLDLPDTLAGRLYRESLTAPQEGPEERPDDERRA
jgi:predicted homoserine dehydrogenase-like protein